MDKLVAGKARPAAGTGVAGMVPGTEAARLAVGKLALDRVLVGRVQARQAAQLGVGKQAVAELVLG
jgi:hypothetical protein